MTMSNHVSEIDVLLAKMFALKRDVLPENRNAVEQYLHEVWTSVTTLTAAFRRVDINEELQRRFEDYTCASEGRLKEDLEAVKYEIDAEDTLALICGPGPIEKVFLFGRRVNSTNRCLLSVSSPYCISS